MSTTSLPGQPGLPGSPPGPGAAIDPQVLARASGLLLRARTVVEGVLSGLHKSPHHGSSVEFAEHKEYAPGDEIRHVDWKLFGKSDKLYVKRFEHETNLRAWLLVDATASMGYGEGAASKWEHARTLAAALAYLLLEQRDSVGLGLFHAGLERYVPTRSDRGHLQALLATLASATPAGEGSAALALEALAERIPRRGLVLVLTDALEGLEPLGRALRRVRHRHHDVALLQVLHHDEVEFPFDELTLFRSLEGEESVLTDARSARASYLAALDTHRAGLEQACRAHEIDFARFVTSEPLDKALVRWLGARERVR